MSSLSLVESAIAAFFLSDNFLQGAQNAFPNTIGRRNFFDASYPAFVEQNLNVGVIYDSAPFDFNVRPFSQETSEQGLDADRKHYNFFNDAPLKSRIPFANNALPDRPRKQIKDTSKNINNKTSQVFKADDCNCSQSI